MSHGLFRARIANGFRQSRLLASSLRLQLEVFMWLILVEGMVQRGSSVVRGAHSMMVSITPVASDDMHMMGWKHAWPVLWESVVTIAILLQVFERRFTPACAIRALCRGRGLHNHAMTLSFTKQVASLLGVFSLVKIAAGIALKGASFDNFIGPESVHQKSVRTFRTAAASVIRDPVLEEVFYRGVVFDRYMQGGMGVHLSAASSSIFFGGLHLLMHALSDGHFARHVHQAITAAGVGYVYCFLFYLSGTLMPVMLLHSLNNLYTLLHTTCHQNNFYVDGMVNGKGDMSHDTKDCDVVAAANERDHSSVLPPHYAAEERMRDWSVLLWVGPHVTTLIVYGFMMVLCLRQSRLYSARQSSNRTR